MEIMPPTALCMQAMSAWADPSFSRLPICPFSHSLIVFVRRQNGGYVGSIRKRTTGFAQRLCGLLRKAVQINNVLVAQIVRRKLVANTPLALHQ